ncbi:glycoside hydrolase family 47 protein [Dothidotthia symphoricarpi CBS 119687]|uniref:alpha-1,2-Mannosidase n=1 Tax=Dothidotthia symphoricarpi CBS 119687 TaxID=1392245 RepID=A0A6A6A4X8_9PLEO|nr:glycoside hydrolase family 47 protein [Dothidotthia symphoricarpi CBS 119687]KAF2125818.1 glycoside hydrolase family 47 protein [Dothidotthia symphoricarpi CBS 119687]
MVWIKFLALGSLFTSLTSGLPTTSPETDNAETRYGSSTAADRAQAVVDAFRVSWEGYYTHAFPNDELKPVTNGSSNSRNGWGASAVDALSTAILMQEEETVHQILAHIPTIDWTTTPTLVSLFETTIRYLGGMLSGFDLLSGPFAHLADNKEHVDALLSQSIKLADTLSFAFNTPSGVPWNTLTLSANGSGNDGSPNGLATTGTLILEWVRLADLSGNSTYASLVEAAEQHLLHPEPAWAEPFPGLLGGTIDPLTGMFLDSRGGWGGGDDSFYEYLLKMWIYDPTRYAELKDRWVTAADSTMAHLASHPETKPELTFVAGFNGTTLLLESEHLACFHGGNFILAGRALKEDKYIAFGLELVDACHATYAATATQIGPEVFSWDPHTVPADQTAFFAQNGFYITNPAYNLRPEVIESYYYAYRATHDTKYQDWAWDAFVAINATTRVGSGFSSVNDVDVRGGGGYMDFQESYWFAETLKYAWAVQVEGGEWHVGGEGGDKWVFNTEAHPVRVFGGK